MKELTFKTEEKVALKRLIGTPEAAVVNKIFEYYIDDLSNVRSIDPSGNMGLQALAAQRAIEYLEKIQKEIFRTEEDTPPLTQQGDNPISPWR